MDAATNFDDLPTMGEFLGDTDLDFWTSDFSWCALELDPEGLHIQPSTTALVRPNQYPCGSIPSDEVVQEGISLDVDEGGCSAPGIMSDYDGASPLAPSSPSSWRCLDASNYCLSPNSLQRQADSSPSSGDPFTTNEQHMVGGNPRPRKILPRPPEWSSTNSEIGYPPGRKCRGKKAKKNCPRDLAKEQRKITKPVRCHLCCERFAFQKSLKRHFVVSHRDYAASIGLPVGRAACPFLGCGKTYTRSDNLTRHLNNAHGRMGR